MQRRAPIGRKPGAGGERRLNSAGGNSWEEGQRRVGPWVAAEDGNTRRTTGRRRRFGKGREARPGGARGLGRVSGERSFLRRLAAEATPAGCWWGRARWKKAAAGSVKEVWNGGRRPLPAMEEGQRGWGWGPLAAASLAEELSWCAGRGRSRCRPVRRRCAEGVGGIYGHGGSRGQDGATRGGGGGAYGRAAAGSLADDGPWRLRDL